MHAGRVRYKLPVGLVGQASRLPCAWNRYNVEP